MCGSRSLRSIRALESYFSELPVVDGSTEGATLVPNPDNRASILVVDSCMMPASRSSRILFRVSSKSHDTMGRDLSLKGVISSSVVLCLNKEVLPQSKSFHEKTSA